MTDLVQDKCIDDFGEQWARYRSNDGFYGSNELFNDMISPLLSADELRGKKVAEIGSGSGRIVLMMLNAGVGHVVAIEPASEAFAVLQDNVSEFKDRVTCVKATGDQMPQSGDLDYVLSIGVLHHIPSPGPSVKAAWNALKPGGKILIWMYGKENNFTYLALLHALRIPGTMLPHRALSGLVWLLYYPLAFYIFLCKFLPLPLRGYMTEVIGKMSPDKRRLVIYDQLNPAYAKYYTRQEVIDLLEQNGFKDVNVHHRHGYSWTAVGTKILGA